MIDLLRGSRQSDTVNNSRSVLGCAIAALLVISASGCGNSVPDEIYVPEEWQGAVDTTLPAETQARQDAIIRLFAAIQQVGIEQYRWDCPDVRFTESFEEFFGSTVGIHRWEWAGEPEGDRISVRIFLEKDDPTAPKVEEIRSFKVSRSGSGFTVTRADAEPSS